MPWKAEHQVDIPNVSVLDYIFQSPTAELSKEPLFIDADRPDDHYLSLDSYRLWAQKVGAGLRKHGFQDGDRVLVFSTNSIYYPVMIMGTIAAGGVFTGSNVGYTARELAHALHNADPKFVFTFAAGLDKVLEAGKQANLPKERIFILDGQPSAPKGSTVRGHEHWSELLVSDEEARRYRWSTCDTKEKADTVVALNYSSGTTGLPKGVMISHKNYVANLSQFGYHKSLWDDKQTKDTRNLCFLPLNHAMAQMMLGMGTPAWGGSCYIMEKFDFQTVLKNIGRFKIDNLMLVPPVIVQMSKHPDLRSGKIDISSVKTVQTGAAPIGGDVLSAFKTLWPKDVDLRVRNGYGMSEASCGVTGGPIEGREDDIDTVGWLLANMEGMQVDDNGKEVTDRKTPGELWVRGPNVMLGYWRNEKATAATITKDGWLQTGDVCVRDERNRIYIVDRKKELIKVKGNQVAPAELEALLLEHPGVDDAAVIGVPHGEDEAPRAYIVAKKGVEVTEQDVAKFVEDRVSRFKRLAGGVKFTPAIPKNPSGKILRKELREAAKKEQSRSAKL